MIKIWPHLKFFRPPAVLGWLRSCRYVGRTNLRLQDRINQYISESLRNKQIPTKFLPKRKSKENAKTSKIEQSNSAFGLHLQNKDYANNHKDQQFSILQGKKYIVTLHLSAIEAILTLNSQTYSISSERICLLIANLTLVDFYPTLTLLHIYNSLSSLAASSNQRASFINQSAPSSPQPTSVGLF